MYVINKEDKENYSVDYIKKKKNYKHSGGKDNCY